MNRPFQRVGAKSNAQVGKEFENTAQDFFATSHKLFLDSRVSVPVGISGRKDHEFDLGCKKKKILVECKSHTWTKGNNMPSAKLSVWNEAMYYFLIAPEGYRKIFFVLLDFNQQSQMSLAEYYLKHYGHMVPGDVEIWEYDETKKTAKRLEKPAAK